MNERRKRGTGSIYQHADGRFAATIELAPGAEGKRNRKTVYAPTRFECEEKIHQLLLDAGAGNVKEKDMPFNAFLDKWLATVVSKRRKNTKVCYEDTLRRYIRPTLGCHYTSRVTPLHVQGLIEKLIGEGRSARVCQLVYVVLKQVFTQAEKWRITGTGTNPTKGVEKPAVEKRKPTVLTAEDAQKLLTAAKADRSRLLPLLHVALGTGMRQGELLGLQWGDVDFDNSQINVSHNLIETHGRIEPVLGALKSHAVPERQIPITDAVRKALISQKAMLMAQGLPMGGFVFLCNEGGPYHKSTVIRSFHRLLRLAGLDRIRFHDLRHTSATLMLQARVDMKVVQEILGHATFAVTADLYSHVPRVVARDAAEKLGGVLPSFAD